MRFLANENFPAIAVQALRNMGLDVTWIALEAPGSSDDEVLARARRERRVLLTFDKDFGELVFQRGNAASYGVVLFRVPLGSPRAVAQEICRALGQREDWEGHFSVVEPGRIRMRALPST